MAEARKAEAEGREVKGAGARYKNQTVGGEGNGERYRGWSGERERDGK